MSETSVRDRLKIIFANEFGIEEEDFRDSTIIDGEGSVLESLERVELLIECEKHFAIDISETDKEMASVRTVGELISYLETRCAESSPTLVTQPA